MSASQDQAPPLHERWLAQLRAKRAVAVLLIVTALLGGLATWADAFKKVREAFGASSPTPSPASGAPPTPAIQVNPTITVSPTITVNPPAPISQASAPTPSTVQAPPKKTNISRTPANPAATSDSLVSAEARQESVRRALHEDLAHLDRLVVEAQAAVSKERARFEQDGRIPKSEEMKAFEEDWIPRASLVLQAISDKVDTGTGGVRKFYADFVNVVPRKTIQDGNGTDRVPPYGYVEALASYMRRVPYEVPNYPIRTSR